MGNRSNYGNGDTACGAESRLRVAGSTSGTRRTAVMIGGSGPRKRAHRKFSLAGAPHLTDADWTAGGDDDIIAALFNQSHHLALAQQDTLHNNGEVYSFVHSLH